MTTYAFQIGQVVNGNTIIALPTGSGNYGGMYQMQRPDSTTFYDYLSLTQLQAEFMNIGFDGDEINNSNPLPVNIVAGGSSNTGGGIGTTTTPNVSTLCDPTAPTHQAAVLTPGSTGTYALSIQGVTGGLAVPVSGTFWQATQAVSIAATVAVSAVSLPLPTGAATAAKQPALGTAGTSSTDVLSVQGIASGTALPVSGTFWQATQPISAAALPLPSGAATQTTLASVLTALQGTVAVSAASLPLPSGAATAAKQPALGTAGSASTDVISVQGITNGTALGVTAGGKTASVEVTPTISTSAYAAGNVCGGKLTFSAALLTAGSGILQSIYVRSKTIQTTGLKLYLFKTNPTNTTWTDHAAPAINAADVPFLVGSFPLSAADSSLGTYTLWRADGLGAAIAAGATTLYGILIVTGTPTFTSTSDITVGITVVQD